MLLERIERANEAHRRYQEAQRALAKELCRRIEDALGWEVNWTLGWEEGGIDTIALDLPENEERWEHAEEYEALSIILLKEFGIYVFVRSGDEWLTKEEAKALRAKLKEETKYV